MKGLKKSPRLEQKRCLRKAPVNPGFKPWVTKKDAKGVFFLEVPSGFSSQNVCFFKVFVNPLTGINEKRRLIGRLYFLEVPSGFEPLYKVLQTSA